MRLRTFITGNLLLGSSLIASAQQVTPSSPTSRFYIGLAAYASNYLPISQVWQEGFLIPLQLTGGYQLTSRLAIQASIAYNGRSNAYAGLSSDATPSGQPLAYSYAGQYKQRLTSTSLLARYTLTPQAANRLQFDLLGGLVLVHDSYASSYSRTNGSSGTSTELTDYRTNNLLPTAGLGVRYRLTQHLQATSNLLLGLPVTGYGARKIAPSASIGLEYHIGAQQPR